MYQGKTRDVYIISSNYGYGWEDETEAEDLQDAKRLLKEYRGNSNAQHKMIKRRIRK